MAKLIDRVTRSYTGQLGHAHLDQPLGTKDHPDQRLLLAVCPLPCNWYKLSQVDGLSKIFSACCIVHTDSGFLQLW
jgi:hypothetical protein